MSWNYRTVHRVYNNALTPQFEPEHIYAIHEAYYDEQNKVTSISQDPVYPTGETVEELKDAIYNYLEALDKPVLEYDSI